MWLVAIVLDTAGLNHIISCKQFKKGQMATLVSIDTTASSTNDKKLCGEKVRMIIQPEEV